MESCILHVSWYLWSGHSTFYSFHSLTPNAVIGLRYSQSIARIVTYTRPNCASSVTQKTTTTDPQTIETMAKTTTNLLFSRKFARRFCPWRRCAWEYSRSRCGWLWCAGCEPRIVPAKVDPVSWINFTLRHNSIIWAELWGCLT